MVRRRIIRSALFLEHAEALFPPRGSPEGDPSCQHFEKGPLRGVEELFSRAFEDQPEAVPGVRFAMTAAVPLFPPMVFYAAVGWLPLGERPLTTPPTFAAISASSA